MKWLSRECRSTRFHYQPWDINLGKILMTFHTCCRFCLYISFDFREKLSLLLNAEKVLVTEDGYHRDWRGVFSLSGLTQSEYTLIAQSIDKTKTLLDLWLRCGKDSEKDAVTLSQLHKCLEIIDRYDIFDDTFVMFSEYRHFIWGAVQELSQLSQKLIIGVYPGNVWLDYFEIPKLFSIIPTSLVTW